MAKLEGQIGYKFKLFYPCYNQVKKFEFDFVNHSFEPIRSEIKCPTYFVSLIWLYLDNNALKIRLVRMQHSAEQLRYSVIL